MVVLVAAAQSGAARIAGAAADANVAIKWPIISDCRGVQALALEIAGLAEDLEGLCKQKGCQRPLRPAALVTENIVGNHGLRCHGYFGDPVLLGKRDPEPEQTRARTKSPSRNRPSAATSSRIRAESPSTPRTGCSMSSMPETTWCKSTTRTACRCFAPSERRARNTR